jgi:hypothetical protein
MNAPTNKTDKYDTLLKRVETMINHFTNVE